MQAKERKILKKIAEELSKLSSYAEILKGTVSKVVLGRKKSKQGRKASYLLTYKGKGNKTKTVYVPKEKVAGVRKMIASYKKARSSIERVVELNVELFKMKK